MPNVGSSTTAETLWPSHQVAHEETLASHQQAIERVVKCMHQHLTEEVTLDEMADLACMSPYYFNRIFRELVGIPPMQFLGALRLEAAKNLLMTTEQSVLDICFEVGYNSLGTFSSRFTQLVGLAPGQFRQLCRVYATDAEQVRMLVEPEVPSTTVAMLEGTIEAEQPLAGFIFIGLFDSPIPQSRPRSCTILSAIGDFKLAIPSGERFFVFAAGMDRFEGPLDFLRHSEAIRGLASAGPFEPDADGQVTAKPHLVLQPPQLLNPPLLMALPLLIDERLAQRLELEMESSA